MTARGGTPLSGVSVGILMLEARFPRIPGDVGNALSWPFPVHYRVVRDATPEQVVRQGGERLLPRFVEAAQELVADGVDGITTTCGFLSIFQDELSAAVGVPVLASSLMQVAMVQRLLPPGKRCGVLTVAASSLTPAHLLAAQVPPGTPVGTTEGGREFTRAILGNEPEMDVALARQDNVEAACALQAAHPDLGAIVLECTNMCPYARDIRDVTGLPVFSMVDLVSWFHAGLAPRRFG